MVRLPPAAALAAVLPRLATLALDARRCRTRRRRRSRARTASASTAGGSPPATGRPSRTWSSATATAGNILDRASRALLARAGIDTLLWDYPRLRAQHRPPSEEGTYADARAVNEGGAECWGRPRAPRAAWGSRVRRRRRAGAGADRARARGPGAAVDVHQRPRRRARALPVPTGGARARHLPEQAAWSAACARRCWCCTATATRSFR